MPAQIKRQTLFWVTVCKKYGTVFGVHEVGCFTVFSWVTSIMDSTSKLDTQRTYKLSVVPIFSESLQFSRVLSPTSKISHIDTFRTGRVSFGGNNTSSSMAIRQHVLDMQIQTRFKRVVVYEDDSGLLKFEGIKSWLVTRRFRSLKMPIVWKTWGQQRYHLTQCEFTGEEKTRMMSLTTSVYAKNSL